jgi:hypothetical protein
MYLSSALETSKRWWSGHVDEKHSWRSCSTIMHLLLILRLKTSQKNIIIKNLHLLLILNSKNNAKQHKTGHIFPQLWKHVEKASFPCPHTGHVYLEYAWLLYNSSRTKIFTCICLSNIHDAYSSCMHLLLYNSFRTKISTCILHSHTHHNSECISKDAHMNLYMHPFLAYMTHIFCASMQNNVKCEH